MIGAGDNERPGEEPETWLDGDDQPLETERLDLAEDDERLPWLESPEDDEWEEENGSDNRRLLGFLAVGLVVLATMVGGIWWFTNRGPDPALVAAGETIEAPAAPYKEAPKDAGGKPFDGTGDASFAVSDGKNPGAQLDGSAAGAPAAAPAPAAVPAPAAPGGAAKAPAPAAGAGGVGVQVGAFSSQAAAEAGWQKLVAKSGGALSGVSHRVIQGKADIGTIHRLQAVAPDAAAATALCGKLKAAGIACQVK